MSWTRRPRANRNKSDEAREHAWSATEAAAFLDAAKAAGAQSAAFYTLALSTGMRKSELGGLKWANVDLDGGKVKVVEQLTKTGKVPAWGRQRPGRHAPSISTARRSRSCASIDGCKRN